MGEKVCLGYGTVIGMAVDNDNLEITIGLAGEVGQKGLGRYLSSLRVGMMMEREGVVITEFEL